MKFLFAFIFCTLCAISFTQTDSLSNNDILANYNKKPAHKPSFKKGYAEMKFYIARSIQTYENKPTDCPNLISFKVIFCVSEKGKLENVLFENADCINQERTKQYLLSEATIWTPGKNQNNINIPSIRTVPMNVGL